MDGCEIEAQCSIVGIWCRLRMLLSPLMWLNIVITCMLMIRRVYLTLPRNYFYFASGIDLWTDCQLITFRALWFQHAPELSKEVGCEGKWDGSISPTGLEKSFPSNVCFFQCRQLGSQVHSNGEVDGLGMCSILDGIVMPHSHHSTRLFWPQSSLKKASHEKDPTGIHCRALSPTTWCIAFVRSTFCSGRYAEMHQLWGWQADNFLSSARWLHSSWTNALNIEHCHKRIDWCSRLISIFVVDVVSHEHWQFHIHTDSLCPKYVWIGYRMYVSQYQGFPFWIFNCV